MGKINMYFLLFESLQRPSVTLLPETWWHGTQTCGGAGCLSQSTFFYTEKICRCLVEAKKKMQFCRTHFLNGLFLNKTNCKLVKHCQFTHIKLVRLPAG